VFALDTNTVAYFLRNEGRVTARMLRIALQDLSVPAIVAYELRYGCERLDEANQHRQRVESFLEPLTILPFDDNCTRFAASIRTRLERAGQPIGPWDLLIAATALAHKTTLVTRNVGEFSRIAELSIENWYD